MAAPEPVAIPAPVLAPVAIEAPAPTPVEAPKPVVALPSKALVQLTGEKIEILQSIQFETAKDVIRPVSEPVLKEVAEVLMAHPELLRVRVEGHTDSQGSAELNWTLSGKRAEAVKAWLVARGVDPSRLEAAGFGQTRPVDTNATPAGRAHNRRVEFRILEK